MRKSHDQDGRNLKRISNSQMLYEKLLDLMVQMEMNLKKKPVLVVWIIWTLQVLALMIFLCFQILDIKCLEAKTISTCPLLIPLNIVELHRFEAS